MDINIEERRENPLLNREEITVSIRVESTPTRKDVKNGVAAKLGVDPSLVIVRKIEGSAGSHVFRAVVHVYKDKDSLSIEPEYIRKRNEVTEDEARSEQEVEAVQS